jgi:hypothetical protein
MKVSRNAPCKRCRVVTNLECWISGIRQAEQDLRAVRHSKKHQASSWAFLAVSPTLGGPK